MPRHCPAGQGTGPSRESVPHPAKQAPPAAGLGRALHDALVLDHQLAKPLEVVDPLPVEALGLRGIAVEFERQRGLDGIEGALEREDVLEQRVIVDDLVLGDLDGRTAAGAALGVGLPRQVGEPGIELGGSRPPASA